MTGTVEFSGDEATLTIGELAQQVGFAPSAVRYYERQGLLDAPARSGGWRRYTPRAIEVLTLVRLAKEAGFSLDEIRELLQGFEPRELSGRWARLASAKLKELDERVAQIDHMRALLRQGVKCGCLTVEDCRYVRTAIERGVQ
jgi:MerR family transcriptional regulator, redox-sensitive transcriptional activator SoxR